jgi:hypothetical protein
MAAINLMSGGAIGMVSCHAGALTKVSDLLGLGASRERESKVRRGSVPFPAV